MNQTHRNPWRPPLLVHMTIALHVLALAVVLVLPHQWFWPVIAVIINHVVLIATGLWPRSHWLGENWTRLPEAAAQRNEIALTIDDGPDPVVTPQVLQILDRYQVKATFFCIGAKAQQFPDLCQEIVRSGHAVENHTQRHWHNFSMLGPKSLIREIQTAQIVLEGITGQPPQFFRAPAGLRNMFLDYALSRLHLRLASWSVRGFDTRNGDAGRVKARLLKGMRTGAILLLHDGHAARTVSGKPVIIEVLPAILEAAHESGLRFVTLRNAAL